ncbi:hypothetical protein A2125_00435 [Candidatus Woesebacteria bacterium GWB1_43_5]|uniref:Recombination endonuclease VII n=1 Tax=Candidatus Woesebacteria bacterium GWB1_43_5 TaxID=1802474 RepID=A0A1F7WSL0_9BACT|nr:MAG: hypothetical protein A2125_00435 [Candidatus Woesebacteria bacterium GWB1_43_5]
MRRKIDDGLNKWQRYRLKDLDAYRKRKREYARTPEERKKRTEYMRVWKAKNRERANELARESHARNKWKHVEQLRYKRFEKLYGINRDQYNLIYQKQSGKCLICSEIPKTERLFHIDHDHKTQIVRGLLCSRCNGALGWFEKNEEKIFKYLKR